MNDLIKTATNAARAFYEASEAFDKAKDALMPLAKQQVEITKRIATECGLLEHYEYRQYRYYDWIELEVGGYYEGASDTPVIECQLWYRGRCGDSDSMEGNFKLNKHIINGEPEKFEAELRAKLETEGQKKARQERERKEREIARLQAELAQLQGETK
jgi:hypothetical protein